MSKKSAFLVMLQISTMIILVIYNNPIIFSYGIVIQILGIAIGIWAIWAMRIGNFNIQPEVKSPFLIKKGPYKWIRNPMYLSVLLFYLPIVTINIDWINTIVFGVLLTVLILKILLEERFLKLRFGEDYINYKSKTKRLIPYLI